MRPGPVAVVAHLLEDFPILAEPTRVRDVIQQVALDKEWAGHVNFALELADRWEAAVIERLRRELNELQRLGRPARVAFNSSSVELVQGACFVEPGDPPELAEKKGRRSRLGSYLTAIQELSPQEFEKLCGILIELFGVEAPTVTQQSADEGIDFYGRLKGESVFFPKEDLNPTIQRQLSIWLVGQAKQYLKTQAGTPEIRDIVGAVYLGRAGAASGESSPFPDMRIRVSDPVFTMLVTGGTLSSRAWELLERSGVIGVDGELLAAFLADRGVGPGDDATPEEFKEWLAEAC